MATLKTEGVVIPFGKHKGTLLTRVPVGYLRWMINNVEMNPEWKALAKAEFERRGDTMPQVELSGHAIDNASLRVRAIWHDSRGQEEGLYSWLSRMVLEALKDGINNGDGSYIYNGLKLVIERGEEFPTLKTIMPAKKRKVLFEEFATPPATNGANEPHLPATLL